MVQGLPGSFQGGAARDWMGGRGGVAAAVWPLCKSMTMELATVYSYTVLHCVGTDISRRLWDLTRLYSITGALDLKPL